MQLKITAIIPCYNVEKYCRVVIEKTLDQCSFIVLIDDGSTDQTSKILQELQSLNSQKIHLITFPQNQGKGIALLEGIKYALSDTSFDALVTIDSDGQHLPSEIPKLVSCIQEGASVVIGSRDFTKIPFRRRLPNMLISFLLRRLYSHAPQDTQSGYRAFNEKFSKKMVQEIYGNRYETEFRCLLIALRDKDTICERQIETIYLDKNRSSHFSPIRDSFLILKVFFHHWRSKSI
ncbi:MAG: hypothetical protein COT84_04795 [Chlamydiae bacterium CG10_big_fil_rev_8_21_14_0_10_35_9]|nr:MAG: hypothetical protein COT84_04795 [Chlamydiae bacterium CG10_big_fil_rev_8_21_14_0_10_35_9]